MRRLLVLVATTLAAFGVAPAIASAGCVAAGAGGPTYVDGSLLIYGGIQCTSGNGSHYQSRTYLQADNGGWHAVYGPFTHDYFSPVDNYRKVYPQYVPCSSVPFQSTYVRTKIVVENMVSGSTSTAYSGAVRRPSNCSS